MDGFSGYNLIKMTNNDKERTTFVTLWGNPVKHWSYLSKGNDNSVHDMMHKEIEVYMDDIIAKSKEGEGHC
jgi:hypothetical protein